MAGVRKRLDLALVDAGLAESRARAQSIIFGGGIRVNGTVVTRPATPVDADDVLELINPPAPYVSRGGGKLRHALDVFAVDVAGRTAIDVGASTGGFTDVLLQAGARRVYAVDVGYGQLAWTLRNDPRVVVMERINARYLESLPEPVDIAVIDVSFISLRLILPAVERLLSPGGDVVCLIKPQFEAGRGSVGRKGVVRDPAVWRQVLERLLGWAEQSGWVVRGITRSPLLGPAGNTEFLVYLSLGGEGINWASAIDGLIYPPASP